MFTQNIGKYVQNLGFLSTSKDKEIADKYFLKNTIIAIDIE